MFIARVHTVDVLTPVAWGFYRRLYYALSDVTITYLSSLLFVYLCVCVFPKFRGVPVSPASSVAELSFSYRASSRLVKVLVSGDRAFSAAAMTTANSSNLKPKLNCEAARFRGQG